MKEILICENCFEENNRTEDYCKNCGKQLLHNVNCETYTNTEYFPYEEDLQKNTYDEEVANVLLSTTDYLQGYEIEEYIDVITKETISGIGLGTRIKAIGDIFSDLTGKEYKAVTNRIKSLKEILKQNLKESAVKLGGNAIIGLDFESSAICLDAMMVSASGTVVRLKKNIPSKPNASEEKLNELERKINLLNN